MTLNSQYSRHDTIYFGKRAVAIITYSRCSRQSWGLHTRTELLVHHPVIRCIAHTQREGTRKQANVAMGRHDTGKAGWGVTLRCLYCFCTSMGNCWSVLHCIFQELRSRRDRRCLKFGYDSQITHLNKSQTLQSLSATYTCRSTNITYAIL